MEDLRSPNPVENLDTEPIDPAPIHIGGQGFARRAATKRGRIDPPRPASGAWTRRVLERQRRGWAGTGQRLGTPPPPWAARNRGPPPRRRASGNTCCCRGRTRRTTSPPRKSDPAP